MAIGKFDVQPLFATPIARVDISDAITPDQIKHIQGLKMNNNRQNLISDDLYIFKHPELKGIADAVQEALDVYARDVMGIGQSLYVTQSWGLMNPPGVGMHAHSHSNSIISGSLYYTEMPKPDAAIIFDKYTAYRQLDIRTLSDKQNIYNTPVNVITPKQNEVLLFSSDINHMVEVNNSDQPRWAIAFNTFVRGTLGDLRDVSELKL